MVKSRKELAIFLSSLNTFDNPNPMLEQHPSDGDVAARMLWQAYHQGNLSEKNIIDMGCGTGIIGIGALMLGAKHVEFIDIDASVYSTLKENLKLLTDNWEIDIDGKWSFTNANVINSLLVSDQNAERSSQSSDLATVIMNPPFGTKIKHADKMFLEAAMNRAGIIYTMHKTTTKNFIYKFCQDNKLNIFWEDKTECLLPNTMPSHSKKIERIDVVLLGIRYLQD